MRRDSRSFADTYQVDLTFFEFFDEIRFIWHRHLCLSVGMCEDRRQITRVGVIFFHLWIKIYDKSDTGAGITICFLLVPLIVCHPNVMDTLLRHTILWNGVRVLESWLGISDDRPVIVFKFRTLLVLTGPVETGFVVLVLFLQSFEHSFLQLFVAFCRMLLSSEWTSFVYKHTWWVYWNH